MRRRAFSIVILVAVSTVLAGSFYWLTVTRHLVSTDNAYVHGEITTVSSRVDGFISRILVSDNQQVRAGDLLVELNQDELKARELEAQAGLKRSQSQLRNLEAKKALQNSLIRQAEAEVNSRLADLEGIGQSLERLESLSAPRYAAVEALEQKQVENKVATAQLAKSQAKYAAEREKLTVLESERDELDARIDQDQAALELARLSLGNTLILAPVDGIVGKRNLHPGQYVQAAATLLYIVQSEIWVQANFKETQIEDFHEGQKVLVKPDAYPGYTIESTIHSFSPATGARFSLFPPENATGNFTKIVQRVPVRISLPGNHPDGKRLIPGMSVVVTVDTRP